MKADEVARYWEANAETWTRLSRAGYDTYRDAHNTPAFLAMLPDVAGLAGLDIGCGEATNTRAVAERGAAMTGLDIAPTFLHHARRTEATDPRGIRFVLGNGAALPFRDKSFDFATAFMSLMDVPDQAGALAEAHRILKPAGFLQFSILHPCFVPPSRTVVRDAAGAPVALQIADYFTPVDGAIDTWMFSSVPQADRERIAPFQVPRFHRPLNEWVGMLGSAGFVIEAFGEPCATEAEARAVPKIADTRIAPLFLHVRVRKKR